MSVRESLRKPGRAYIQSSWIEDFEVAHCKKRAGVARVIAGVSQRVEVFVCREAADARDEHVEHLRRDHRVIAARRRQQAVDARGKAVAAARNGRQGVLKAAGPSAC